MRACSFSYYFVLSFIVIAVGGSWAHTYIRPGVVRSTDITLTKNTAVYGLRTESVHKYNRIFLIATQHISKRIKFLSWCEVRRRVAADASWAMAFELNRRLGKIEKQKYEIDSKKWIQAKRVDSRFGNVVAEGDRVKLRVCRAENSRVETLVAFSGTDRLPLAMSHTISRNSYEFYFSSLLIIVNCDYYCHLGECWAREWARSNYQMWKWTGCNFEF